MSETPFLHCKFNEQPVQPPNRRTCPHESLNIKDNTVFPYFYGANWELVVLLGSSKVVMSSNNE